MKLASAGPRVLLVLQYLEAGLTFLREGYQKMKTKITNKSWRLWWQNSFGSTDTFISVNEMIKCPFQTKSDSFYFVDGKLIMHNKADYAYNAGV